MSHLTAAALWSSASQNLSATSWLASNNRNATVGGLKGTLPWQPAAGDGNKVVRRLKKVFHSQQTNKLGVEFKHGLQTHTSHQSEDWMWGIFLQVLIEEGKSVVGIIFLPLCHLYRVDPPPALSGLASSRLQLSEAALRLNYSHAAASQQVDKHVISQIKNPFATSHQHFLLRRKGFKNSTRGSSFPSSTF